MREGRATPYRGCVVRDVVPVGTFAMPGEAQAGTCRLAGEWGRSQGWDSRRERRIPLVDVVAVVSDCGGVANVAGVDAQRGVLDFHRNVPSRRRKRCWGCIDQHRADITAFRAQRVDIREDLRTVAPDILGQFELRELSMLSLDLYSPRRPPWLYSFTCPCWTPWTS